MCNKIIVEDIEKVKDVKFLQCPYCGYVAYNKNYKGKQNGN